jgi:hypothetical protein
LPLPGNPVIQTHHPFAKVGYLPDVMRENIVNLLISLRNRGYKQSTLRNLGSALKHLAKHSVLGNPESVKSFKETKQDKTYKKKLKMRKKFRKRLCL